MTGGPFSGGDGNSLVRGIASAKKEVCTACLRGPGGASCTGGLGCIGDTGMTPVMANPALVQPHDGCGSVLSGDPDEVLTLREMQRIVSHCDVTFTGWFFHVAETPEGRAYLQVRMRTPCTKTGVLQDWAGRKWLLSPHMTKSEVVQTAFKAVLTAAEHEARERFLYKERPIFGPHYDVDKLWGMATAANEETRHG